MTSSLQQDSNSTLEPRDEAVKQSSLVSNSQPTIALLPCCDLFKDFFDTVGMSFETFCNELTGGWMFNYIDALQLAGVRTVLFFMSSRVSEITRFTHAATGATVCILPAPKLYRAYRAILRQAGNLKKQQAKPSDTKSSGSTDIYSAHNTRRSLLGSLKNGIVSLGSYLSTPLGLLVSELRHEGCSTILCQDYEYARFDICVLLGRLIQLPVLATFQGGDRLPSSFEYPFRWLALRASAGLIVAPQIERQRIQAFYQVPPAKVVRIFNPMDATTWCASDRNQARLKLGIPKDAQVVMYHGRIQILQKGLDVLLEAWDRICRDRPDQDLRLLLVGTGSDAEQLHQRIAAMQLKGVMWIDEYVRDRNAIQQYLSAADVYTLPSRKEGFPVAPLEAMACGLPIVAADAAGISDILEEGEASGGLVVPRENPQALALALGRVLDDEVWRRELGKRARSRAQECFSLEIIGKQLRDILFIQKTQSGKFPE